MCPDVCAWGFSPGDIITAIINLNENTVSFYKTRVVLSRHTDPKDKKSEPPSRIFTMPGVYASGVRFGVQFDRAGTSIELIDYENLTKEDALPRAVGFKEFGLGHIRSGEWQEAAECFRKAVTHFHNAGEAAGRKEVAEMHKEALLLLETDGVGSEFDSPFRDLARRI